MKKETENKTCGYCQLHLVQKQGESGRDFRKRQSCGRTCANRLAPKRNLEGICAVCNEPCSSSRKRCKSCIFQKRPTSEQEKALKNFKVASKQRQAARVKKGRMRNGDYILVVAPDNYPGFKYREKYTQEHHLVWWQNTGQVVPKGMVVHHLNEDKHDNTFTNLELKTNSEHTREHHPKAMVVFLFCPVCEALFEIRGNNYRYFTSIGKYNFTCSRSCGATTRTKRSPAVQGVDIQQGVDVTQ